EALGRGDQAAFEQALEALSLEEQQAVMEAIQLLQGEQREDEEEEELDDADVLQKFEPLLQRIAGVAMGDTSQRSEIEELLPQLKTNGWEIADATHRIWAGERDSSLLVEGL